MCRCRVLSIEISEIEECCLEESRTLKSRQPVAMCNGTHISIDIKITLLMAESQKKILADNHCLVSISMKIKTSKFFKPQN